LTCEWRKGHFVDERTNIVIAMDARHVKTAPLKARGQHDIVKGEWLERSFREGKLLPWYVVVHRFEPPFIELRVSEMLL
jgi:hypothetical protein